MATATSSRRGFFNNARVRNEALAAYLFILPYLLVTLIFTLGVILFAVYVSFTKFDLYTAPEWVGLENYADALDDRAFWRALWFTVKYTVIILPSRPAAHAGAGPPDRPAARLARDGRCPRGHARRPASRTRAAAGRS